MCRLYSKTIGLPYVSLKHPTLKRTETLPMAVKRKVLLVQEKNFKYILFKATIILGKIKQNYQILCFLNA
jgi:hypothetical protein